MIATITPTSTALSAVASQALDDAREAQTRAALYGTALLAELIRDYAPEATTLTVDATTGAPVAIAEIGITVWEEVGDWLLPDALILQLQRTVRALIDLNPAALTEVGWRTTNDGRYVILIG